MKTKLIVCLILGCSPFFLIAQNSTKEHKKLRDFIDIFTESETYFDNGEICAPPVIIYSEANFRGERKALHNDWSANSHRSYWNDEIASIEVPEGWEVWLYEHADFRGKTLTISRDWSVRNNPRWQNRISSIRVVPSYRQERPRIPRGPRHRQGHGNGHRGNAGVSLYEDKRFSGDSQTIFEDWSVRYTGEYWNDRISSIYIPSDYVVILYEHANYQGRSITLQGKWSIERQQNFWGNHDFWNDRVSSIRILHRK